MACEITMTLDGVISTILTKNGRVTPIAHMHLCSPVIDYYYQSRALSVVDNIHGE